MIVEVKNGLMWRDGHKVYANAADSIAQRAGFNFAERFVRKYEGRQVLIGGAGEVLKTGPIPALKTFKDAAGKFSNSKLKAFPSLRQFSPKRQSLESIYREQKKVWWPKHQRCEYVDPDTGAQCGKRSSRRPHHKKKRGRFLCDTTTWMGICEHPHHARIHDNEKEAYRLGYLIKTTDAERRGPPIITPLDKIT